MCPSADWEQTQHDLNPNRDAEQERVAQEVAAKLRRAGVELSGDESGEDLAEMLSAVDRFQEVVEELGGDRMVDDPRSSDPYTKAYVLPRREADETARHYISRLYHTADQLIAEGPRDEPSRG